MMEKNVILAATLPEQAWFHIRLEIIDASLKIFVNHSREPQMVINTVGLGTKTGKVGFWLGNSDKVYFKNFSIRQL